MRIALSERRSAFCQNDRKLVQLVPPAIQYSNYFLTLLCQTTAWLCQWGGKFWLQNQNQHVEAPIQFTDPPYPPTCLCRAEMIKPYQSTWGIQPLARSLTWRPDSRNRHSERLQRPCLPRLPIKRTLCPQFLQVWLDIARAEASECLFLVLVH